MQRGKVWACWSDVGAVQNVSVNGASPKGCKWIYWEVEIYLPACQQIYSSLSSQRGPSVTAAFCFVLAAGTDVEITSLGDALFCSCLFVRTPLVFRGICRWMLNIKAQRGDLVWIWGYEHTCSADGQRQSIAEEHGHLKQRFYALDSSTVVFCPSPVKGLSPVES